MRADRLLALLTLLLALLCSAFAVRADTIRIEALDGGVVACGAVTQIIAQSKSVAVVADGQGSAVNLSALTDFLGRLDTPGSGLEARNGGAITLNPLQTTLGNQVELHLNSTGVVTVGTLKLGFGSRLSGSGSLPGNLINSGEVSPGSGAGTAGNLTVSGNYTQTSDGRLRLELGGDTPGTQFDQLTGTGPMTLGGTLDIGMLGDFIPAAGSRFAILTSSQRTGTFASTSGLTVSTGGRLTLDYGASAVTLAANGPGFRDGTGPVISNIQFNGSPLVAGLIITRPGTITLTASDPSGVARVEFYVDGALIGTATNSSNPFSAYWDISQFTDGDHSVTLTAYDTLNNATHQSFTLNVQLAPPPVPILAIPQDGLVVHQPHLSVGGSASLDSQVVIYRNGVPVSTLAVAPNGVFSGTIELQTGENSLQAAARNRKGSSALSTATRVTLDNQLPPGPSGLTATSQEGGTIRLIWTAPTGVVVKGYDIYRSSNPFLSIDQATRANSQPVTITRFDDLPPADGQYYYRVVAIVDTDWISAPSNQASAPSDSLPPRALSIEYTPAGPFDPQTGRFGVGDIQVKVKVSEPLLTTPFLSLTPTGGIPLSVALNRVNDTEYSGHFEIKPTTPSGTAYAVFSARDRVGNRGTEIGSGGTVLIDTAGPGVTALTVTPPDPIRNDQTNPVTVTVRLELNEALPANQSPQLSDQLSAAGRQPQVIPLAPDGERLWRGAFTLPADAGLAAPERLQFAFRAEDDLSNVGTQIQGAREFQVYQGSLPPLAVPTGLQAKALPGGRVQLSWNPVNGASEYQLYRQAPDETALTAYQRMTGAVTFTDATSRDGRYRYTVASVRKANGEEAVSGQSNAVEVMVDSVVPAAPTQLQLQLTGSGVRATWQAPASSEVLTYSLYRAATAINTVAGLTPLQPGIRDLSTLDPAPSDTAPYYAVTAVDAAGNESPPSISAYLDVKLLPVTNLTVVQEDTSPPMLAWTAGSTATVGYHVYLQLGSDRIRLNATLLTTPTYTDVGYSGAARRYVVTAVDSAGVESLAREIFLPALSATVPTDARLLRGLMNRLDVQVRNEADQAVDNIRLRLRVATHEQPSATFTLATGATRAVPVMLGGYADLPDWSELRTTLEVTAPTGEQARLVRSGHIEVGDGALAVSLLPEDFTRGGTGKVRFSLTNTSPADVEIVTATGQGNADSDELRFILSDTDDNVLSTQSFRQALGEGVVTLPNGKTVARIPPGSSFTSQPVELQIPLTAPAQAVVRLDITQLHYHLGQDDQVDMPGPSARRTVSLVDVSYRGEIQSITPALSYGDQDIVITGRAIDRQTGNPLPQVALKLVITVDGFERSIDVFTDATGSFSYTFKPLPGEAGIYQVAAVHPDLVERPVQGTFTISRLSVSPAAINLTLLRNYVQTLPLQVTAGAGTTASNVRLLYEAAEQPMGVLAAGLTLILPAPLALQPGQSSALPVQISADNTAAETGTVILTLKSQESGNRTLGKVTINYRLYTAATAAPALFYSPSFIETGVARDNSVTETVTLENRGLAALEGVQLALVKPDGSPAPAWISLSSPAQQGNLAVGEQRPIGITAAPTASVAEGFYEFRLRITSANAAPADIRIYVSVTQSGIGSVLFHVSDIYTATHDKNGNLIQGLAGAQIRVQNEAVLSVDRTLTTDNVGEALFRDLPTGHYKFRASASNHQEIIGRFTIKPGITVTQEVFLNYNLVTVEWSVTEIRLTDRYNINLNATYETDVPAAVVVMEPTAVNLPVMQPGEVFYGELNITNYGLVRADNVKFYPPSNDQYFTYEFLTTVPDSLEARQHITIPYRIRSLKGADLNADGQAGGGGCFPYKKCGKLFYDYTCANGILTYSVARTCWYEVQGQCGVTSSIFPFETVSVGQSGETQVGTVGTQAISGDINYVPMDSVNCQDCSKSPSASCDVCNKQVCESGKYSCEADSGQNDQQCDPEQTCLVCVDGECKKPETECGANPDKKFTAKIDEISLDAINEVVNKAASLLKTASGGVLDVDTAVQVGGGVEIGEECCKDCAINGPIQYTEATAKGTVSITATLNTPTKPVVEIDFFKGYRIVAEAGIAGAIELKGSGSVGFTDHIATGCDKNNCTKANFKMTEGIAGKVVATVKGDIETLNYMCVFKQKGLLRKDCWQMLQGFEATAEGKISSEISEFIEKGLAGTAECMQVSCKAKFDGVKLSATVKIQAKLPFINMASGISLEKELVKGRTLLSKCEQL